MGAKHNAGYIDADETEQIFDTLKSGHWHFAHSLHSGISVKGKQRILI